MYHSSWRAAARAIASSALDDRFDTLSSDVFDTLLMRKAHPDFVARSTNRHVASITGEHVDAVAEARLRAWNMLCATGVSAGFDHEARIGEHFLVWMRLLVGDRVSEDGLHDLAARALARELEAERRFLKPNDTMVSLLRSLKGMGKRVVAVSDMYLGGAEIRLLLDGFGFSGLVDEVVSSADFGLQKKTGRLFARLVDQGLFGLTPGRALHVGDDPVADGVMPARHGLKSAVVYDTGAMLDRHRAHYAAARNRAEAIADMILGQELAPATPAERLGAERFGPIYAGFVHGVFEEAMSDGVSSVWFLAREGWFLHEIYGHFAASFPGRRSPPSGYLYASRLATMRSQLTGYGRAELGSAKENTADWSVAKLLAPLSLHFDVLAKVLDEVAMDAADVVDDAAAERLERCVSLQREAAAIGERELAGLGAYLEKAGFPRTGKVAIVDVGWGGQIQHNLMKALSLLGWETEVVGYYLGTNARAQERRASGLVMKAIVADTSWAGEAGAGAFHFVQGLELATRAPHGSVRGYGPDGSPVLASDGRGRTAEQVDDAVIAAIQTGALAYVDRYATAAGLIGVSAEESVRLSKEVVDLVSMMPRKREAEQMLAFNNVANLGMDESLSLGGRATVFSPRKLLATLRRTLWQEGTCAVALPFVGPFALLCYRRRKGMLARFEGARSGSGAGERVSAVGAALDSVVVDALDQDLGAERKRLASQASKARGIVGERRVIGMRDRFALALVSSLRGLRGSLRARAEEELLPFARFFWKHPWAERVKLAIRK
jgi:FMN phosphatase YigB (HAD superfamily)